jgi:2'-5' RNA ligase
METPSGRGISIWLSPLEEEAGPLRELIRDLARELGTPAFEPHVTLLPGLPGSQETIAKTAGQLLTTDLEAMRVTLGPAQTGPPPFRCLYLPIALTFRLVHAHAVLRQAFAVGDERPFEPHLSLVYGHLGEEQGRRLAGEIAAKAPGRLRLGALEVVRTEGPVERWQSVARLPLPRPDMGHDQGPK